jgi:hypothetical protein
LLNFLAKDINAIITLVQVVENCADSLKTVVATTKLSAAAMPEILAVLARLRVRSQLSILKSTA